MGERKIIWSHRATIKLTEILNFYNTRNQNKEYSTKLFKRIKREIQLLAQQPKLGTKTSDESVRGLIVGDYMIFYGVTKELNITETITNLIRKIRSEN